MADQLDQDAAVAVIQAVQVPSMHAELLAVLEYGYGYGLPLPVAEECHTLEVLRHDDLAGDVGLSLRQRWADWDRSPYDAASSAKHISLYRLAGEEQ